MRVYQFIKRSEPCRIVWIACRGIKPMTHLREGLGDEQFAFMPGTVRGTADTIFAVRQRIVTAEYCVDYYNN